MSVEFLVDRNWYGKEYALHHMFIPKDDIHTNSDWLCMLSRDGTGFKMFPMSAVRSAPQMYSSKQEIMYVMSMKNYV